MKAQVSGQIFIYIFAMLVVSLVLIFGWKAVTQLTNMGKCGEVSQFKSKISNAVKDAQGYGTEKKNKPFYLPPEYTSVCFADLEKDPQLITNRIIRDSAKTKTTNTFLTPKQGKCDNEWFLIEDLAVKTGYECIETRKGKIAIDLFGCGDKTYIMQSPSTETTLTLCT
ncbi:hypothetical protein HYU11_00840 [Candidatus Woesearchaeota archaeon]|nr:hypothetical protein [Candidatus Woesearchaeota archaeon]